MKTHYDSDTLLDYLHGALQPATDAAIFAHLETCAECRALRDEEAAFGEALRASARAAELEFPSMIRARVWDAVRREQPSFLDRLRAWGPAIAVPIAAALAVAAYLGAPVLQAARSAPGVAASYYLDAHNAEAMQNPLGPNVGPAVFTPEASPASSAASYIETADAATLDGADGALR